MVAPKIPVSEPGMTLWRAMPSKDHPSHLDHPATKPGPPSNPRTEHLEIRHIHNRPKTSAEPIE
jgi:hypothetical protein